MTAGKGVLADAPETRPAEIMASEEERRAVRLTLAGMPPRQAELLIMRYSGASYKEIALAQGISPSSIGPTLLRAEREFEKRYRALVREEI
jgi:RNA polymerase sigma-70 factor (ECF subfamily)